MLLEQSLGSHGNPEVLFLKQPRARGRLVRCYLRCSGAVCVFNWAGAAETSRRPVTAGGGSILRRAQAQHFRRGGGFRRALILRRVL